MNKEQIQELLRDERARRIFMQVVERRKVQHSEVQDASGLDSDETAEQLDRLEKAHLIKVQPSSLRDFSIYYPTTEGLEAQRRIQRSLF
ncbi:MAG: hypothetical protein AAF772_06375 [Acidobacteriota bacterium]